MAQFSKFKFLFALKFNFNGGPFLKKNQNLVISKRGKEVRIKLEWLRKLPEKKIKESMKKIVR